MALPIRTTIDDVVTLCKFLATKPTGATVTEAKRVLDARYLDGRKLAALKRWDLVTDDDGRLKVTGLGRAAVRGGRVDPTTLRQVITRMEPYKAIVERAVHRQESVLTATDVASHWHEHFDGEAGDNDKTLNDQAVCFFQLVEGAELGNLVVGRGGAPTRIEFDLDAVGVLLGEQPDEEPSKVESVVPSRGKTEALPEQQAGKVEQESAARPTGNNRVFISHGANRQIVAQLKEIVQFGKLDPVVAVENETASKPVPDKVLDDMRSCFAAIIHVASEKTYLDEDGKQHRMLNENVLIEIGAAMALYKRNFILLVEDGVQLPSNLQGLYQCRYEGNKLDMEATMKLLKAFNTFGQ